MRTRLLTLTTAIVTLAASVLPASAAMMTDEVAVTIRTGDLITSSQTQAVYYFAPDGRRYVFPNEKTYFTWYENFDGVKTIEHTRLQALPLGRSNITYRPGVKMIKITTDPRTYVVERGGILRHVGSEEVAKTLYGLNWNNQIDDVPDGFFSNYTVGTAVAQASDYNVQSIKNATQTVTQDKSFDDQLATITIGSQSQGFVPQSITVKQGTRVTWVNRDIVDHSVMGSFGNSGILSSDQEYDMTFNEVGSFDYNDGTYSSTKGTINVVQ